MFGDDWDFDDISPAEFYDEENRVWKDASLFTDTDSEGCYVATAVYGSYDCPQVWVLRRFRDFSLRRHALGRLFIRGYYAVSPKLVTRFGDSTRLRAICRKWLDAFVLRLKQAGVSDTPYQDPAHAKNGEMQ